MAKCKKLSDKEIIGEIVTSAKLYEEHLLDRNMIIISYNRMVNEYSYIECEFLDKHYQHLTGVKIRPSKGAPTYNSSIGGSANFLTACLDGKLKQTDYKVAEDGTTPLKLAVLKEVLTFKRGKNMLGAFSGAKNKLYTERLVGNVRGCLGFVKCKDDPSRGIHVPNTVLNTDIRDETERADSVVCIFEKNVNDEKYSNIAYMKADKVGKKSKNKPVDFHNEVQKLAIVKNKVDMDIFL